MAPRTWVCQRVSSGAKCSAVNPRRLMNCRVCGKKRRPTQKPAHTAALDLPYEEYVRINGGEFCAICGVLPSPDRRLDRDHEHRGEGKPRGLLCWRCNKALDDKQTPDWLRRAADYLERAA